MEYRPLDITVISATDLKNVNIFMKMAVFVEVYISGEHEESPKTKRKTHMDRSGGCDPEWNHRFKFTVEEASIFKSFINFYLKAERGLGDKVVGVVRIPLMDLLQDSKDNKTSQDTEAEYQVSTTAGKAKGSLKISFRFGEKFVQQVEANPPVTNTAALPEVYSPPKSNGTDVAGNGGYYLPPPGNGTDAGHGGFFIPPYALHAQPGAVPGKFPVPPGYSYRGYGGGGYIYPYAPAFYPPPPVYSYPGQLVAYAYNPVQQPDPVPEKNEKSGFGMNEKAGMVAEVLVGDVVSEAAEMALEDAAEARNEDIDVGNTDAIDVRHTDDTDVRETDE
ncbi:hypothetical protein DCAR_0624001 [Daucus carota subsp. sativus]|uniref:Uncharacterized protein n=1 Tax=Daucus carota subsp. sativus TaxID=79200 RepID=A0A161XCS2_DAUCS|nr:PREDICTED: protein SRC2-like [Daucus carota subsp. sativus]WOH04591.1 hypothetical protein DCAR_0624001 [Daucus carota subsp. sativus]